MESPRNRGTVYGSRVKMQPGGEFWLHRPFREVGRARKLPTKNYRLAKLISFRAKASQLPEHRNRNPVEGVRVPLSLSTKPDPSPEQLSAVDVLYHGPDHTWCAAMRQPSEMVHAAPTRGSL
jgi:hypothetical protein